eukprot:TRINITY_DN5513_c0_g2_i1.p1 TRINITY_DN5513_c0_g2~~TRINITY_DN5513_c0_g2_i1.p1  ORF type:complete len:128 (+),score=32.43 TRINITY_DN5513_c0_g2_i1:475-858(+)
MNEIQEREDLMKLLKEETSIQMELIGHHRKKSNQLQLHSHSFHQKLDKELEESKQAKVLRNQIQIVEEERVKKDWLIEGLDKFLEENELYKFLKNFVHISDGLKKYLPSSTQEYNIICRKLKALDKR